MDVPWFSYIDCRRCTSTEMLVVGYIKVKIVLRKKFSEKSMLLVCVSVE